LTPLARGAGCISENDADDGASPSWIYHSAGNTTEAENGGDYRDDKECDRRFQAKLQLGHFRPVFAVSFVRNTKTAAISPKTKNATAQGIMCSSFSIRVNKDISAVHFKATELRRYSKNPYLYYAVSSHLDEMAYERRA
jgi:hypothetical protein